MLGRLLSMESPLAKKLLSTRSSSPKYRDIFIPKSQQMLIKGTFHLVVGNRTIRDIPRDLKGVSKPFLVEVAEFIGYSAADSQKIPKLELKAIVLSRLKFA